MTTAQRRLKTALYALGIALCVAVLLIGHYPPSAYGQDMGALNQHLDNTDSNVARNTAATQRQWAQMESQRDDLQRKIDTLTESYQSLRVQVEVMYGIWDLVKWLIGGLVLIFGGQLALTWKKKGP